MVKRITEGDNDVLDSINFLRAVHEVDSAQFHVLMNISRKRELNRGEILMHQGTASKELYFVVDGQMGAYVRDDELNKHIQIGIIRPGEMIGELSLALDVQDRQATVRVTSDTATTLSFRQETFTNRDRYPELDDRVYFIFWRDLTQSLKWRVDMFEMKYPDSPRIAKLAKTARDIRRSVPSVHDFAFDPQGSLEIISRQAAEIGHVLKECNQLVAFHRSMEIQ
jgi:CRP-like cAMP-binding protein